MKGNRVKMCNLVNKPNQKHCGKVGIVVEKIHSCWIRNDFPYFYSMKSENICEMFSLDRVVYQLLQWECKVHSILKSCGMNGRFIMQNERKQILFILIQLNSKRIEKPITFRLKKYVRIFIKSAYEYSQA